MSGPLSGKVVIITGATRGIGRALSLRLAAAGADIVGTARNPGPAEDLGREIDALGRTWTFVTGDVSDFDDCQRVARTALEAHQRIDILINNAGTSLPQARIDEIDEKAWRAVSGPTLDGPLFMSRAVLPTMRAQRGGTILNIASGAGVQALATMGAYGMSKAAAIQLARFIAVENLDYGIRANALVVGAIDTELSFASLLARGRDIFGPDWTPSLEEANTSDVAAMTAMTIPPENLANAVLALCTPDALEINGSVIAIDRGFSAGAYSSAYLQRVVSGLNSEGQ